MTKVRPRQLDILDRVNSNEEHLIASPIAKRNEGGNLNHRYDRIQTQLEPADPTNLLPSIRIQ